MTPSFSKVDTLPVILLSEIFYHSEKQICGRPVYVRPFVTSCRSCELRRGN